jgi:hypothetical protein
MLSAFASEAALMLAHDDKSNEISVEVSTLPEDAMR